MDGLERMLVRATVALGQMLHGHCPPSGKEYNGARLLALGATLACKPVPTFALPNFPKELSWLS